MKKLFLILVTILVASFGAQSQTPGFKASGGAVLPHITTVNSNQTFMVDRGGGASPANITFTNLTTEISRRIAADRSVWSRDMVNLWSAVASNKPVRFLIVGDSVSANVETPRGVMYSLDGWMTNGGYGSIFTMEASAGGTPLLFYGSLAGGATYTTTVGFWIGSYIAMPTASTFTTIGDVGGVMSDKLSIYYYAAPSFGSFLVETQRNGGSFGTLATVNASVGGTAWIATNWTLATLTNYNVRITSTGTNAIGTIGLTRNDSTNSHAWANTSIPGATISDVVTNAAFFKFLTNYNPQVILVEAKDPYAAAIHGLTWLATHCTNRDLVIITPSSNSDDGGIYDEREAIIQFGLTNKLNVFDKYSYFLPTNYFFNGGGGFYVDGAHLAYRGIDYISTAFASWFGVSGERFASARLRPIVNSATVDISGKANLAGGNNFTGDQHISGGYTWIDSHSIEIRGASDGLSLWNESNSDKFRIQRDGGDFRAVESPGYTDFFSVSNRGGIYYIELPLSSGPGEVGFGKAMNYNAAGIFIKSNAVSTWPTAPRTRGDSYVGNSNGVVFMLTSGLGITWTATNKIAP